MPDAFDAVRFALDFIHPLPTISNPTASSAISGSFTFSAEAVPRKGSLSKIEFYLDNFLIYTGSSSPSSTSINSANYADGTHILKVIAYNSNGLVSSKSISVNFSNNSGGGGGSPPQPMGIDPEN